MQDPFDLTSMFPKFKDRVFIYEKDIEGGSSPSLQLVIDK